MGRTRASSWMVIVAVLLAGIMAGRCTGRAEPKPDASEELLKLKVPSLPKTFTPAQKADIQRMWGGRGEWFVKTGCFACHTVSVYDVTGLAPVGPDLSNAVEDVQARFGRKLEDFLNEPQGTMQMVFTQLLVLTPEQKAAALEQLRAAFKEYERQKATKK